MTDRIKSGRLGGDGLRMPVLVPNRNSASGYSIQYLSIEVDADLARALDGCAAPPKPAPVPPAEGAGAPQGLCDTTLTERFANPDCRCDTYAGNLGPCKTFEMGQGGRCVYCDHEAACHPSPAVAAEPVALTALKNLLTAIQSRAINKLPIPYWEGTVAMETLSKAEGEAMDVLKNVHPVRGERENLAEMLKRNGFTSRDGTVIQAGTFGVIDAILSSLPIQPGASLKPRGFLWKESPDQINWHYTDSINTYIPAEAIIEPLYLGPPADGTKS